MPFISPRPSLDALFTEYDLLYLVKRSNDEVLAKDRTRTFVHPAMLRSKLKYGREHPFLRALWPSGSDAPTRIVDVTLGLCTDALHIGGATAAEVVGLESSPVIFALAQEGLQRMRSDKYPVVAAAAAKVKALLVDHRSWLAQEPDDAADVIFVHPMFERPPLGGAGFDLFRVLADPRPPAAETLQAMARVARRRVVLKVKAGWRTLPSGLAWHERVEGARADLLVHDVQRRD